MKGRNYLVLIGVVICLSGCSIERKEDTLGTEINTNLSDSTEFEEVISDVSVENGSLEPWNGKLGNIDLGNNLELSLYYKSNPNQMFIQANNFEDIQLIESENCDTRFMYSCDKVEDNKLSSNRLVVMAGSWEGDGDYMHSEFNVVISTNDEGYVTEMLQVRTGYSDDKSYIIVQSVPVRDKKLNESITYGCKSTIDSSEMNVFIDGLKSIYGVDLGGITSNKTSLISQIKSSNIDELNYNSNYVIPDVNEFSWYYKNRDSSGDLYYVSLQIGTGQSGFSVFGQFSDKWESDNRDNYNKSTIANNFSIYSDKLTGTVFMLVSSQSDGINYDGVAINDFNTLMCKLGEPYAYKVVEDNKIELFYIMNGYVLRVIVLGYDINMISEYSLTNTEYILTHKDLFGGSTVEVVERSLSYE